MPRGKGTIAKKPVKKPKKIAKPDPPAFDKAVLIRIGNELDEYNRTVVDEKRKAKDDFMDLYQKCEFAYKQILIDYKLKVEGLTSNDKLKTKSKTEFNPNNLKIYNKQYANVLKYAGITVDDMVFNSDSPFDIDGSHSCRKLRDMITHGSSRKAVNEVFDRKTDLFKAMEDFLSCFPKQINNSDPSSSSKD